MHHCDGTDGDAHLEPGPTATSALDDAIKRVALGGMRMSLSTLAILDISN
jgi:hypothetical protein